MQNQSQQPAPQNLAQAQDPRAFAEFLYYLPDALIEVDGGLRVTYANRVAGILLKFEPEELVGRSGPELLDTESLALALRVHSENMARLAASGPPYQRTGRQDLFEVRFRRSDGSLFPAEVQGSYVLDGDGMPVGSRYIFRDITHRKAAEAALRRSEAQLRQLATNAPVILFRMDAEERFTLYEGKALARGLPAILNPERVLGRRLSDLDFMPGRLAQLLRDGLSGQAGQGRFNAGGATFDITVEPLTAEDGSPDGLVGVATDSTQIVQTERALFEAQKLESLGMLASGMAQEFQELLSSVSGLAAVLQQDTGLSEERRGQAAAIEAAAARGTKLTERLLTFARGGQAEMASVDLGSVLTDAARLARRTMPAQTSIEVRLPERRVAVSGDGRQLTQAVLNMLVNARDAMPWGGTILLSLEARAGQATILVEDSGEGMDEETQLRLFEPFFTTKRDGAGIGLGMSIAYGVIRAHEGTISVRSAPGHGTTFAVRLPFEQNRSSTQNQSEPRTILVVDDDVFSRRARAAVVERFGLQTVQAADGAQAVEQIRKSPDAFAGVIMALRGPGLSQQEATRAIAAIQPRLPVLVCDGSTVLDLATHSRVANILPQPFTPEQLTKVLRSVGTAEAS